MPKNRGWFKIYDRVRRAPVEADIPLSTWVRKLIREKLEAEEGESTDANEER